MQARPERLTELVLGNPQNTTIVGVPGVPPARTPSFISLMPGYTGHYGHAGPWIGPKKSMDVPLKAW